MCVQTDGAPTLRPPPGCAHNLLIDTRHSLSGIHIDVPISYDYDDSNILWLWTARNDHQVSPLSCPGVPFRRAVFTARLITLGQSVVDCNWKSGRTARPETARNACTIRAIPHSTHPLHNPQSTDSLWPPLATGSKGTEGRSPRPSHESSNSCHLHIHSHSSSLTFRLAHPPSPVRPTLSSTLSDLSSSYSLSLALSLSRYLFQHSLESTSTDTTALEN